MQANQTRQAAWAAFKDEKWPELLSQARLMQEACPDLANGYVLASIALQRLGRSEERLALLTKAVERFPDHPQLQTMLSGGQAKAWRARAGDDLTPEINGALAAQNWSALKDLCARLRVRSPDDLKGYLLGTRALREMQAVKQAETLLGSAMAKFPGEPALLLEHCAILFKQKRLEEADRCLAELLERQPGLTIPYSRRAFVLMHRGKFDDAETLLQDAYERFPGDVEVLVHRAILSTRRKDLRRAKARWEEVRAVAPNDLRLRNSAGLVTMIEQLDSMEDDGAAAADPQDQSHTEQEPQPGGDSGLTDGQVLKRFEGLGGNCEFGLVQRAAGIEPLGLLRFTSISKDGLIQLLKCGLEGVGSEENTTLSLNEQQEYILADKRSFSTHTFINFGEADEAVLYGKLLKRTMFLRDKLLAELHKGNKIFVFRPKNGAIDDAAINQLHAALQQFGPNALVCVRDAPESEATASVVKVGDNLFIAAMPGHSSKLSLVFIKEQRFAHWMNVTRAVLALRDAAA